MRGASAMANTTMQSVVPNTAPATAGRGRGQAVQRTATSTAVAPSANRSGSSTGALAWGRFARKCTIPVSTAAPADATPNNGADAAGAMSDPIAATRPPAQTSGNRGAATTLASGATSGSIENSEAEKGAAVMLDAAVSASASRTMRGSTGTRSAIHDEHNPENTTMPSVERAESAKETDNAAVGSKATKPSIHAESAPSDAGLRRTANDSMPAKAITAARTAEGGAAARTR